MAEGEHTIIGKIPRERLNQIAARKLTSLGIPVRLGADQALEADLAFAGSVMHPLTGQAIARARFAVVGHDQLRFLDPPLSALGLVSFYDVERSGALEQRVVLLLQERSRLLQELAQRLRRLRIDADPDPERLVLRAVVKTVGHAFELLAGPEGTRVSRVAPVGGRPYEVPPSFPPLQLEEHETPTDLEIFLDGAVARMAELAREDGSRGTGQGGLEVTPPPRNALTLDQISRAFGPQAVLAPNAPVEVFQEFQFSGTRYRFVATREVGTSFRGRLIGPSGDTWSERFDLAQFPGTLNVVASALGAAPADQAAPRGSTPQHLLPHIGEIWVMSVVVEQSAADEVRYVGTDIDGHPYGAARVLKRSDFEAVFTRHQGGWRLLIVIDQVQGDSVLYRQLDSQRQPVGAPRKMVTAVLVANFVPETAAF